MKTQKFNFAVILIVSLSLFSFKCSDGDGKEEGEDDQLLEQNDPVVTVLKPNENAEFYTQGGVDSPDYIVIEATATDDSIIEKGSVTIFNSSGAQVGYYEETSATQNGQSINTIYTSFSTLDPGGYVLEYEFIDVAGNSSTEVRNVTCTYSEIDGNDN